MQALLAFALALIAPAFSLSTTEQTNPLGKVLELMADLSAKITADGEAEAKAYKEYFEWCDNMARENNNEIKTSTSQKEKLEAKIGELSSSVEASTSKIEELSAAISTSTADLDSATKVREKEAETFKASEKELVDTVDTLDRALSVLEREMQKNPASLAQLDNARTSTLLQSLGAVVDAAGLPGSDHAKLLALVQSQQREGSDAEDGEPGAPAAASYKSHSSGITDLLEDMKEKADSQLSELRKAETNAKNNFAMLKQSLDDQIAADNKDMKDEKTSKAEAEEGKAASEGDLSRTTNSLARSEQSLATGNSDCMQTAADHQASVKSRDEELKVVAEATKILQDTSSGAVDQTYSMLQLGASSGFRIQSRADLARSEVVTLVKHLAEQHHSSALAQLASRVAAVLRFGAGSGEDPFAKVKGLIQNMIGQLEKEMQEEASQKAYCDEEMSKTEAKKSELEDDNSKLTSKIDQATAKSAELKEQVKELQGELSALAKSQAEMDTIRSESHADFVKAKEDLELGLSGVRKALGVLRDYYASKEGGSASMLQDESSFGAIMQQPAMPTTHSKSGSAASGIIGILETCESDFASNLAKEETAEADAQTEYETTTQENKVTKTTKEQDVKYKTKEIKSLAKTLSELSADQESTSSELSAVLEYYSKLKEKCIAKPETYEERKKRREAEISGLKEALSILESETAFVQRRSRRGHMRGSLTPR